MPVGKIFQLLTCMLTIVCIFLLKLCIGWFLLERDLDFKCMKREKKKLKRKYYDDDELEIKYLNSKPQIEVRFLFFGI